MLVWGLVVDPVDPAQTVAEASRASFPIPEVGRREGRQPSCWEEVRRGHRGREGRREAFREDHREAFREDHREEGRRPWEVPGEDPDPGQA
jgi:hypothetical protein